MSDDDISDDELERRMSAKLFGPVAARRDPAVDVRRSFQGRARKDKTCVEVQPKHGLLSHPEVLLYDLFVVQGEKRTRVRTDLDRDQARVEAEQFTADGTEVRWLRG